MKGRIVSYYIYYSICGVLSTLRKVFMKNREKARKELVQRWNDKVAPHMPSNKRIRDIKNHIKRVSRERQLLVEDQMLLVQEQLEQDKVVREYLSNESEPEVA